MEFTELRILKWKQRCKLYLRQLDWDTGLKFKINYKLFKMNNFQNGILFGENEFKIKKYLFSKMYSFCSVFYRTKSNKLNTKAALFR